MIEALTLAESRILVIEDDPASRVLVMRILECAGYLNVFTAASTDEGLDLYDTVHPDLVLLDLVLTGSSGLDFLEQVRMSLAPDAFVPIVVLTADRDPEVHRLALRIGASDFLYKPADASELLLRVHNHLHAKHMHDQLATANLNLERRIAQRTRELKLAHVETLERLTRAASYRDDETGEHCKRVGCLAAEIAKLMELPHAEVERIRLAAPLHDIGKIGIPDSILFKPGRLSDEEFELVKSHVEIGAQILEGGKTPLMKAAADIARFHHERWDGKGYLLGLRGEEIPVAARIVAVVDVFDALGSPRPYKEPWAHDKAVAYIQTQSGSQFDPKVVEAFLVVAGKRCQEVSIA